MYDLRTMLILGLGVLAFVVVPAVSLVMIARESILARRECRRSEERRNAR